MNRSTEPRVIVDPPRVSVVVPARNEARNLPHVLTAIPEDTHQVILVDGHSVDDTIDVAESCRPGIEIVRQTRKGKGNALACGFAAVTGDVIVMLDADGSADPDEIPRFVEALVGGADFAKGSRFISGGGSDDITPFRRAGNAFLNGLVNRIFRTRYTDLCYGYNVFWADLRPYLDLPPLDIPGTTEMIWGDGFEIETLINVRVADVGLSIAEIPSIERPRIHGESNLNAVSDGLRVLRTILTERRRSRGRSTAGRRRAVVPGPRTRRASAVEPAEDAVVDLRTGAGSGAMRPANFRSEPSTGTQPREHGGLQSHERT